MSDRPRLPRPAPLRAFARIALRIAGAACVVAMAGCASTSPGEWFALAESYGKVIADPIRTEQDRTMDARRHPAELLSFTQVKPGMQVLDVAAGGGYTSQLLAIAVGPSGTVWAQAQRPSPVMSKRLADQPQKNLVYVQRPFDDPVPPEAPKLDLITLVLNYHDIVGLPLDRAKMNERLFAALKPGGRLIVVDHSGRKGTGITEVKTLHRIEESVVSEDFVRAGFVFQARGDFLRNPADQRDDSSNPPKLTDKFALRFVRP